MTDDQARERRWLTAWMPLMVGATALSVLLLVLAELLVVAGAIAPHGPGHRAFTVAILSCAALAGILALATAIGLALDIRQHRH